MRNFLFCFVSILFLSLITACEKEKVVEIKYVETDKLYSWKELSFDKGFDRIYYNLSVDSNQLYAQIPFMIKVIKGPESRRAYYIADINNDYFYQKIPMTDFLYAYVYNKTSVFVNKINGSSGIDGAVIDVKKYDSTVKEVHNYTRMEFNQNKNLLLEYWGADMLNYNLLLVKYDNILFGNEPSLKLKEVKKINLPNTYNTMIKDAIRQIKSIDNYYLVITHSGMYKVLLDGTYQKVSEHLFESNNSRCVKRNNAIYVFDYDVTLVSTDNGNSFTTYNGFNDNLSYFNYFNVGDSTIALLGNQIYLIRFNSNTDYFIRPLKCDGLEKLTLNSLVLFKDTIYVGTTAGLFYKPRNTFFDN